MSAQMQMAQAAISTAEAAQADVKVAKIQYFPEAKKQYAQADDLLKSARQQVTTSPDLAKQDADRSTDLFTRSKVTAASEEQQLAQTVDKKRDDAERAQKSADVAGAATHPLAKPVYGQGATALTKAQAITGTDPSALRAAIERYDEAGQLFRQAVAKAHIAPLEIREAEPSGSEVTVTTGRTRRFSVKANAGATARWSLGDERAPGSNSELSWEYRPHFAEPEGTRRLRVTISDGAGQSASKEWTVRVEAPDSPPRVVSVSPGDRSVDEGEPVSFSAKVDDPDLDRGDQVTCRWTVDNREGGQGCEWRWQATRAGTHRIELIAADSRGKEARETRTITVRPPDPKPLVERWLKQYCDTVKANYEKQGEKATVTWRDVRISGDLPTITVSFTRVDGLGKGEQPLPKTLRLTCERGQCREATGG